MMMQQPSLAALMEEVDSRYTLVVIAARRARQLVEGAPRLEDVPSDKPVTVALREIAADKISYERTRSGYK